MPKKNIIEPQQFNFVLTVVRAFLEYRRGHRITEDEEIASVIEKGYLSCCVKSPRN